MKEYIFYPDNVHCPLSCLCSMCINDNDCNIACKTYIQMATECKKDECDKSSLCKLSQ
jgi:hypothetical protein